MENPSSKEQCTNIKLSDSECCYIETNSDSNVEKECDSYNLNKINVDLYIKRELKLKKFSVITDYLEELNDIESLDDNGVINQLKKNLNFNVKVECKSLSKTLDYSTITFTKEDVQIAKKDIICESINSLGMHEVLVKLYKKVSANLRVSVVEK